MTSAGRVIVSHEGKATRVYVHPETLQVLKTVDENARFMKVFFRLHGELLMGNRGSAVVELAASWAIIMILTGLYLWWPRKAKTLGGIVYPRLARRLSRFLARSPWRNRVLDFRTGIVPVSQRPALGQVLGRLLEEHEALCWHGGGAPGLVERAIFSSDLTNGAPHR